MKKTKTLILTTMLALSASAIISCKKVTQVREQDTETFSSKKGSKSVVGHPVGLQTNLRMYGYMETWGTSYAQDLDNINLDQLTDLCISFVNPNASGNFTVRQDIIDAVPKAHLKDVRVHFAIGGGGGPAYWDNLMKPAVRAQVISNIRKVLTNYNFDGLDVDLEGPRITADYNSFMVQLSDTLRVYNKLLSAAVAHYYQGVGVGQVVYDRLDFLNVMCYDYTGNSPRSHSSYANFQSDYAYFKQKISGSKINMGIPAYAWEYEGNTKTQQVSIKTILQQAPGAMALNYKYPTSTKSWWYDGHPVLRQKVQYCLQQGAGGMMIWQMMHDPKDDATSLLKLMNFCAGNPNTGGFDPAVSYSVAASHSWQSMQVAGASLNNSAGIQQNPWTGANNQLWYIKIGSTDYSFVNKNSGKVLDELDATPSGVGLQFVQSTWHGGGNQRYLLTPDVQGYYKIKNVASNRLVSVEAQSSVAGAKIVQLQDVNGAHQKWIIGKR